MQTKNKAPTESKSSNKMGTIPSKYLFPLRKHHQQKENIQVNAHENCGKEKEIRK